MGALEPPARLLEKYDLLQYSGIVRALRAGNVRAFNAQLEAQREFFVGHGVYLILEKLKLIAYRNLTHRVQLVLETNKLPLRHVTAALQWLGDDIDADEVECLIANLICQVRRVVFVNAKRSYNCFVCFNLFYFLFYFVYYDCFFLIANSNFFHNKIS